MKIYIVTGASGSYDDYMEWPIASFTSEDNAKLMVERCNKYIGKNTNPYDRDMCSNEQRYFYYTTDLLDVVPQLD